MIKNLKFFQGSIPAWSIVSACSVMVIIDASQALDPGSIPGRRTKTFYSQNDFVSFYHKYPASALCVPM